MNVPTLMIPYRMNTSKNMSRSKFLHIKIDVADSQSSSNAKSLTRPAVNLHLHLCQIFNVTLFNVYRDHKDREATLALRANQDHLDPLDRLDRKETMDHQELM